MKSFDYPEDKAPTCLIGFNLSRTWRLESLDMTEKKGQDSYLIIDEEPWEEDGKTWFVSNLQKYSKFGFIIQWPLCFHFWIMRKQQQQREDGYWIPETEHGWYFRIGIWRFDVPGTNGKHWMGPFTCHPLGKWD